MGVAQYEAAIKKLFPEGDYWDAQFADANSDVSLFCKAKLPELIRFRERMNVLQSESVIEKTEELIADWERVLLGTVNHGLDINHRRLLLKSKRDVKLNREELQKIASMFGLSIGSVVFPYRPAFFGFSKFNTSTIGSLVVFSVLLIKSGWGKTNFRDLIKQEYPSKRFTRLHFGYERLAYFPVRQFRLDVNKMLRESAFGFNKAGVQCLFPSPSYKYKGIVDARFRAASMGFMKCGLSRLVYSPIAAMRGIAADYFRPGGMGFARFGRVRIAYSPAHSVRRFIHKYWRSASTGLARFGFDRLLFIPLQTLRGMTTQSFRTFQFSAVRFGASRIAYYANGFQDNIIGADTESVFADFYRILLTDSGAVCKADAALVDLIISISRFSPHWGVELVKTLIDEDGVMTRFDEWFMRDVMHSADFYLRLEQVLIDYWVSVRKMFSEFEQAIKNKLLANQIAYFNYEGE